MPIKQATPAPLTFKLRTKSTTVREPHFYVIERPELSICQDVYGLHRVDLNNIQVSDNFKSIEEAEKAANELHARFCTFEQPQSEDAAVEPLSTRDERQHASDCAK